MDMNPHHTVATALVADDHEVFRMALAAILKRDCGIGSVAEAGSLDDAVRIMEDSPGIGLATFDLAMPGMAGPADLRSVRRVFPDVRVVVVSASERRADILAAVAAGAHGFIPKTLETQKMSAALSMVLSGSIFLPWSVADFVEPCEEPTGSIPIVATGRLTERQAEVLRLIRTGKSNKEIARALGLTESTVKVHTNALYRALGVRNRVNAASVRID